MKKSDRIKPSLSFDAGLYYWIFDFADFPNDKKQNY